VLHLLSSYDADAFVAPLSSDNLKHSIRKAVNQTSRSAKKNGNRVLLVGRVRELALYRAEVLKHFGFNVSAPENVDEALAIMKRGDFDALVLSYTLPSETVEYLAERAREACPGCPVVAISHTSQIDRRVAPDAIALAAEGPPALVAALRSVLRPQN
jgi:DNA-binding response OmpR family regulator